MKVLAIARVGITRFLRDRSNLFSMLLLPLALVFLVGQQFGGESRPTIAIGGPEAIAVPLVERLEAGEAVDVRHIPELDALRDEVAQGAVAIGVLLTEESARQLEAGEAIEVEVLTRPDGNAGDLMPLVTEALTDAATVPALTASLSARAGPEVARSEVQGAVHASMDEMTLLEVEMMTPDGEVDEVAGGRFAGGAAQQLALMVFLFGLLSASSLAQNRALGLSHRMLATPTRTSAIVLGEAATSWFTAMLQGVYIMVATALLFDVDWGNLAVATVVLMTFGGVAAALGMLLGAWVTDEGVVVGIGLVAGLSLAALGGSMVPAELFTETMRSVSQFTPHYWALSAFDVLREGGGIADVGTELAVLGVGAAALFAVAAWRLRVTLTRT